MKIIRLFAGAWFTGALYCLAAAGYVFYTLLIMIRMTRIKAVVTILLITFLLSSFAAAGLWAVFLRPSGAPGDIVEIAVKPGTPVIRIAERLEEKNVVHSARALVLWLRIRGMEKQVQAGNYSFREHEGILSVTRKLKTADPFFVELTIPEGLTQEQTAGHIAPVLDLDSAYFVTLCSDSAFVAQFELGVSNLEGYLFPDTYRFSPGVSAESVIARLVGQFKKVYSGLPSTWVTDKYTMSRIVTLASIVEKEATLASERFHIAGVFHNRLEKGWTLGADPTVRYLLRKFSGPLRVSELKNPSPYNTRVHPGLPPGPICSPGKGAIEATVSPLKTADMFFVARWDGSGAHDFSVTNAEHDRKKMEIRWRNEQEKRQSARGNLK